MNQRLAERGRVGVHLLLDDDAAAVFVGVFDGIFDGDDLGAAFAVDEIDHVVEGGGFADAGGAGDEDEAGGPAREFIDDGGKAERFARADVGLGDADGHLGAAAVEIDAGAKASDAGPMPGEAELPFIFEDFLVLLGEQFIEERAEHFFGEGFVAGKADFAVDTEGGGDAAHQMDIACAQFAAALEDLIEADSHSVLS